MGKDNHSKTYTAADIERYHKGQLSPAEMHAMEKAALDDPFLADALEGYADVNINVQADLEELRRRLAEKVEPARVIPIGGASSPGFRWLRVAVIIFFLAGAGLLSYFLVFKQTDTTNLANREAPNPKTTAPGIASDTPSNTTEIPAPVTESSKDKAREETAITDARPANTLPDPTKAGKARQQAESGSDNSDSLVITGYAQTRKETTSSPVASATDKPKVNDRQDDHYREKDKLAKAAETEEQKTEVAKLADDYAQKSKALNGRISGVEVKQAAPNYQAMNHFRGRITDAQNNPLPFSNVTNTTDNVGTYTDAKGYFTLVSTDSVLDVQVRSLGFVNNRTRLVSKLPTNQVLMKEDRSLSDTILSTAKPNFTRARDGNLSFEEPEPAEGWDSYDTYLSNNLNVPESYDIKKKDPGSFVELSFEVSKDGDPIKIKVEKSLCKKCDEEARRLVEQGPKWKRKSKKGKRTTVKVPFIRPVD